MALDSCDVKVVDAFSGQVICRLLELQWLSSGERRERFGAFGVPLFLTYSLFNGEPSNYLEFPNHLIDGQEFAYPAIKQMEND